MSDVSTDHFREDLWSFLAVAVGAYAQYGVAFITPYLRDEVPSADWVAALPTVGIGVGYALASSLRARSLSAFDERLAARGACVAIAAASVCLSAPLSIIWVTVCALVLGAAYANVVVTVNACLARRRPGEREAKLAGANFWAMLGALAVPLMIAAAARESGLEWRAALLVPALPAVVAAYIAPPSLRSPQVLDRGQTPSRFGRRFWVAWLLLLIGTSVEFSFVSWGAAIAALGTRMPISMGTAVASLFVLGMLLGRLVAGLGMIPGRWTWRSLEIGLVAVVAAGILLWVGSWVSVIAAAFFVAGLGISNLYPFVVATALSRVPGLEGEGGARLALATACAIGLGPLVFGAIAATASVMGAWGFALASAGAALVLSLLLPKMR